MQQRIATKESGGAVNTVILGGQGLAIEPTEVGALIVWGGITLDESYSQDTERANEFLCWRSSRHKSFLLYFQGIPGS